MSECGTFRALQSYYCGLRRRLLGQICWFDASEQLGLGSTVSALLACRRRIAAPSADGLTDLNSQSSSNSVQGILESHASCCRNHRMCAATTSFAASARTEDALCAMAT